ncbi:AAA domain-containing protein [Streptosporangium sp. NPDC000239]|uniref:DEAD/DEAH box helicase n=1 Tax=Streptosporangium sp. NPDC000239 TaxID=3154248 RepID=UPI00331C15FF
MSHLNDGRSRIMEFWRACELFSPQSIPKVNPRDEREPVFHVKPGEPLPWHPDHPLRRRRIKPTMAWRHILYGGVFPLDRMRVLLEHVFGTDSESFDAAPRGSSALFALILTEEGRPLLGTWEFSSGAWAAGRTVHPGPGQADWLEGFETACGSLGVAVEDLVAAFEHDERATELRGKGVSVGRPLGYEDLASLVKLTAEDFGVESVLRPEGLVVKSVQVSRRREHSSDEGTDFLNSFIADDLKRVAAAVRTGAYGSALDAYLQSREPERTDLRQNPHVVLEHVAPDLVPAGRWPQGPEKPLALSQQFAVNTIMTELAPQAGLFAVNGPPGTGKTTMLRDLIAANVVERALRLSKLAHTALAFTGEMRWQTGHYRRVVSLWREDLTGFEMVVTSANNGAVENVTTEIPARGAIDAPWRDEVTYFDDIASRVLGEPAWGLVAAKLGRKSNRVEFAGRAWYGTADEPGLRAAFEAWQTNSGSSWSTAVRSFNHAYEKVRELQREHSATHAALRDLSALRHAVESATRDVSAAEARLGRLRDEQDRLRRQEASARQDVAEWEGRRQEHQRFQPTLVTAIFTLGKASREWLAQDRDLAGRVQAAQHALGDVSARLTASRLPVIEATSDLVSRRTALDTANSRLARARSRLAEQQDALGAFFPGEQWWADAERREHQTLWTDAVWNAARSELFVEALRLHQAFLRAEASRMRKSLQAAMDVLGGETPADVPEAAVRAAWQSLFFLVPVVSTTFASFHRVFSHLTQEALGWLFIDEAGQAAPQLAAGAIWRSRRVVAVGDPLQLEPVVTLPFSAQRALSRTFGVREERWLPGRTSVQQLADHVNAYGTSLPGEDAPVWVGAPLRVHRRCDQPMFGISNAIAYDGLMVYGKPEQPPVSLPDSMWIDVTGTASDGHWVREEGEVLERILRRLTREGISPESVFVISPFRDVVRGVKGVVRSFEGVEAGTVHTAQGREADVVVLVLGGDPSSPGAKRWAAQRPNLLNVAVSRAKRRLYVIGDHTQWSKQRHFDVLARDLQRVTLPPPAAAPDR